MIRQTLQTFLLVGTSAVVIPYATSLLCNLVFGWPQRKDKYRRAFSPKKVYALNYSLLQKLFITLKYAPSYIRWRRFYRKLDAFTVRKNIPYGRNDCSLDVYYPNVPRREEGDMSMPVVVFVYGGAWSSGNKAMYGHLCVELANKMKAVVCCPNVSTYPKGYVDDMIQDVVDCVAWVCDNPHIHGANKNDIILVGHSSGAHLCVMSVLELLNTEIPGDPQQSRIRFDESYFTNKPRSDTLDDSSGSSASFCVVNGNQDKPTEVSSKDSEPEAKPILTETAETSITASTFEVVKAETVEMESLKTDDNNLSDKGSSEGGGDKVISESGGDKVISESDGGADKREGSAYKREPLNSNDEIARPKELETPASLTDLSKSIKVVIGLAGVYDINDHFYHESIRGVEDISMMARAMYGQDYFDRFSPSILCRAMTPGIKAPCILLIHGTEDYVVPVSSTTKLAEALKDNMIDSTVRIIPGCDHYEVCLDLMDSKSRFYKPLTDLILQTSNKVLNRNVQ